MEANLKNMNFNNAGFINPDGNNSDGNSAKNFLHTIYNEIYEGLQGLDRQEFIGSLVRNFTEDWKKELKGLVQRFLINMISKNASDIDFGGAGCGEKIWFRVHGDKKPEPELGNYSLDHADILIQNLLTEKQREFLYTNRNIDFSYEIKINDQRYRFRADIYFDLDHLAMNMRHIPNTIRPFKSLGFHPHISKALSLETEKQGLILVTGITGSGKSSTLDSIIDANNKTVDAHVVIIGAPVETVHNSNRCIVRHREVGKDVLSFKAGAVQALRQDPDIIVIGEMRDSDTIMTALEITDSGHKVFSTLHTASAVESIDRIIGEVPVDEQERIRLRLADTLKCIVSQKLLPDIEGTRVIAKEVLLLTTSVKTAIRNGNIGEIYQMIFEGTDHGMITLEQDLLRLTKQRYITPETATHYANNKKRMSELLN